MTIEINVKEFPTYNTMNWHFLVEMDVGPNFLYQSCSLCPYESQKTNSSPKNTFKIDLSIWQLLGLERALISELPHMPLSQTSKKIFSICKQPSYVYVYFNEVILKIFSSKSEQRKLFFDILGSDILQRLSRVFIIIEH